MSGELQVVEELGKNHPRKMSPIFSVAVHAIVLVVRAM